MAEKYQFTNWTEETFVGRFGGQPYTFAPQETISFDLDKHYMLTLLSKQLADRELIKGIKSVGRDSNNVETWAKSLDANGKPFVITSDMRKDLMRRAIGDLVDTPVPVPGEEVAEEVGASKNTTEDITKLQEQIANLTEMVQSFAGQAKTVEPKPVVPDMSIARQALVEMAQEAGIVVTDEMTKEQLVAALNV